MAVITLITGDVFAPVSFAVEERPAGLLIEPVLQELTLVQTVEVFSSAQANSNAFVVSQTVGLNRVIDLSIAHHLSLSSGGAKIKELWTSTPLQLTHAAYLTDVGIASNTLTITQSANASRGLANLIVFAGVASCNMVKLESIAQSLTFHQGATALIDGNWQFQGVFTPVDINDYDPSLLQTPPVPTTPFPIEIGNLIFRNVDFGDGDSIEHARISRRTRGEEIQVYRDSRWGRTEIVKFKIQDISQQQGQQLLSYISDNLAQRITFKDWFGVSWIGIIINPEATLVQSTRGAPCGRFEIELHFQGTQV